MYSRRVSSSCPLRVFCDSYGLSRARAQILEDREGGEERERGMEMNNETTKMTAIFRTRLRTHTTRPCRHSVI